MSGLLMAAMLSALGSGRSESSGPERGLLAPPQVTVERLESLGHALLERVLELAAEFPPENLPETGIEVFREQWGSTPECSVPVGIDPAGSSEIARYLSDEDGDTVEAKVSALLFDGWGQPIEVYLEPIRLPARPRIVLRSAGGNGVFETLVYEAGEFAESGTRDDIVWSFGDLCRRPAQQSSRE